MCPEDDIISAYLDGELESTVSIKVEEHIAGCERCKEKLRAFQRISHILLEDESPDYLASMEKVKRRIQITQLASEGRRNREIAKIPWWHRKIEFPLPLAVAAMVLIVFLGFMLFFKMSSSNGVRMMRIKKEPSGITEVQVSAPIEDLEALLKTMDNSDFKKEVIIQLPPKSQFLMVGEPRIMREAEFTRIRLK